MSTLPRKLRSGDQVRVVAPSRSLEVIGDANTRAAVERLTAEFGVDITFGAHVRESGPLGTGPVEGRVADLHAAFADPDVAGILTVVGGHQSNQLLPHLDYELIAANPKVFCGFSDITALQTALLARSGLITYSGPHFSTFAMLEHNQPTVDAFRACLFDDAPLAWNPASTWTDDEWFRLQYEPPGRGEPDTNSGWWVLQPGTANGPLAGGNLCTVNLLQGTPYWPDLSGAILAIEDDFTSSPQDFDRNLVSLLQTGVAPRSILIGRFQRETGMSQDLLTHIVATKPELNGVPVLANVDFGHTNPLYTFPVGGECYVAADPGAVEIVLTRH